MSMVLVPRTSGGLHLLHPMLPRPIWETEEVLGQTTAISAPLRSCRDRALGRHSGGAMAPRLKLSRYSSRRASGMIRYRTEPETDSGWRIFASLSAYAWASAAPSHPYSPR
jgi:hypothetical protein